MDTDDQLVAKFSKWFRWLHPARAQRLARHLVMAFETPVNGFITWLDRLGIDAPLMNFWQRLGRKKKDHTHAFTLMPGVPEMLKTLKGRYRLAVVTTRSEAEATAFLREHHLQELFELVVSRTSTRRLKPHPEPILFAARELNLPVSRCLMVGDTTPDIRSAHSAGAPSVGVLCGYGTREELEKAGAAVVLEQVQDVVHWLMDGDAR